MVWPTSHEVERGSKRKEGAYHVVMRSINIITIHDTDIENCQNK